MYTAEYRRVIELRSPDSLLPAGNCLIRYQYSCSPFTWSGRIWGRGFSISLAETWSVTAAINICSWFPAGLLEQRNETYAHFASRETCTTFLYHNSKGRQERRLFLRAKGLAD